MVLYFVMFVNDIFVIYIIFGTSISFFPGSYIVCEWLAHGCQTQGAVLVVQIIQGKER